MDVRLLLLIAVLLSPKLLCSHIRKKLKSKSFATSSRHHPLKLRDRRQKMQRNRTTPPDHVPSPNAYRTLSLQRYSGKRAGAPLLPSVLGDALGDRSRHNLGGTEEIAKRIGVSGRTPRHYLFQARQATFSIRTRLARSSSVFAVPAGRPFAALRSRHVSTLLRSGRRRHD